ncbi:RHS repeat domain-containing protein, partial [Acinetobacter baumannii]
PASNIIDSYHSHKAQSYSQTTEEKDYGYNRLFNNVVKEYLDQQYQYDAYGQLVRQKTSQGDLNLEWDVYGRMVKSRNSQYTVEYRYDALGRRIQKRSKHHHTGQEQNIIYGWDGDTLAYESTEQLTKHYIYEKDSFVPMLQAVYLTPIELHQTPDWSDRPYNIHRDPLWKTEKQGKEFDDVWFYHCDHLGTPQEMTDHTGAIIWKAEYKAWGECKAEKAKSNFFENSEIISNNIRFQGQYFDEETGLHYNRYRYYSPYVGRFVSKDPIGLLGGSNNYAYAPSPTEWVDPLGLSCQKIPKGFKSFGQLKQFGQAMQAGFSKLGFKGATMYMQGSAHSGRSFETGKAFDDGRVSDFDIAVVQPELFEKAKKMGIAKGNRTLPIEINSVEANKLGINGVLQKMSKLAGGRDVNVMIFDSPESAKAKAEGTRIPANCM